MLLIFLKIKLLKEFIYDNVNIIIITVIIYIIIIVKILI